MYINSVYIRTYVYIYMYQYICVCLKLLPSTPSYIMWLWYYNLIGCSYVNLLDKEVRPFLPGPLYTLACAKAGA